METCSHTRLLVGMHAKVFMHMANRKGDRTLVAGAGDTSQVYKYIVKFDAAFIMDLSRN
jgi:hypothetical protein